MSINGPEVWGVIPAAGSGSRMQAERPKQYLPLSGATVLDVTLDKILNSYGLSGIVVALGENDAWWPQSRFASHPKVFICSGGKERSDSVLNALIRVHSLSSSSSVSGDLWVMVHDAARPCVTREKVNELVRQCHEKNSGGLLAAPVADTLKRVDVNNRVVSTEDRSLLWQAHTPQYFPYLQLRNALRQCLSKQIPVTDEASAVEQAGGKVCVVADRRDNIKITMPEDLAWAEYILNQQKFSIG